ncbi:MAG: asparagine synthase (glutamine-hydrolyzing) [Gemmatimonadetes bacterium]|nr:asparagine synthase (glutamine-hydrolyzing) [Gemmatimonadota bacterium]
MCGIAGFAGWRLSPDAAADSVRAMCDAITHRGPDDWGSFVASGVALGMRRLSIIDVGGGHQPIPNEDGSIQIVFNGEIYNHRALRERLLARGHVFRTHSDTETIVHGYEEYGDDVVQHLRGMFTFAIWDAPRQRLFVGRDRVGIKPLSYWEHDGGVAFCSELRSLLALPRFSPEVADEAVARFLAFGYVPDPLTIFRGVKKLPPGHVLSWTAAQGVKVARYWRPEQPERVPASEGEAITELRRLLADAVESHLESEVPLGAFLSGGLDSSTVVALMAKAMNRKVQTFSIGFEEQEFNEAPDAAIAAELLGTDHTSLIVHPDVDALFDGLVAAFDEPFGDSSAIPTYLVSELARRTVTVSLSGDGGDELFGGYTRYLDVLERREWPRPVRAMADAVGHALPPGTFGRGRLLDIGRSRRGRYTSTVALPPRRTDGGIARDHIAATTGNFEEFLAPLFDGAKGRDFATQVTFVDLQSYLPGDILTKVDRTTMAVSLEARVPLLDHPLIEFAAALPSSLKFRDGRGKHLFRKAIEAFVPPVVLTRPKRGFAVPLAAWMRGPLAHRLEAIRRDSARSARFVDPAALERVIHEHQSGRRDHSPLLWNVIVLDLWLGHLASGRLARRTWPTLADRPATQGAA